jgi:hypothetical protein
MDGWGGGEAQGVADPKNTTYSKNYVLFWQNTCWATFWAIFSQTHLVTLLVLRSKYDQWIILSTIANGRSDLGMFKLARKCDGGVITKSIRQDFKLLYIVSVPYNYIQQNTKNLKEPKQIQVWRVKYLIKICDIYYLKKNLWLGI